MPGHVIRKKVVNTRRSALEAKWGHAHMHSRFSALDGMSDVRRMFAKIATLDQPYAALTDHGSMPGTIQAYKAAKEFNIQFFPGAEWYLLDPEATLETKNAGRFHVGILANDFIGYKALVKYMTLSHTRPRFNRFPRLTLEDLASLGDEAGEHLTLTTGCYFGLVQQYLVNRGYKDAKRAVELYGRMFPNTFVEVQNHNIVHPNGQSDADLVRALIQIADETGLPVMVTQDAHYTEPSEKPSHALVKKMVYGGLDDAFPGDSFHLASTDWVAEHYEAAQWDKALEGSMHLLSLHDLTLPALDKYKTHVPRSEHKDPQQALSDYCDDIFEELFSSMSQREWDKRVSRLAYELEVIAKLGMANYFWVVLKFVKWCHEQHICVEARGSANGSIVCFLLGITQVDPIKYKTSFDRFLAIDRTQPPDVDMDIEDGRRGEALAWWDSNFESTQIGTFSALGYRPEDGQGSIVVTYVAALRKAAKDAGKEFRYNWVTTIDDVRSVDKDDYQNLVKIDGMRLPDGAPSVIKSYGVHAAGVLIAGDDMPITDYVPKMLVASSDTPVSQFEQDDVEMLGYTKMDILGQTSLTAMRICQELIGREDPADFRWIPEDDPAACKILRSGERDNGVFHYEAHVKGRGGKEMGIRSTMDAILGQALYMPGAMDIAPGMKVSQKDLYVEHRRNPELRKSVKYMHPAFEKALSETYGAVIFQEQVLDIMRGLGMGVLAVNKFFKVVKDSGKGSSARNAERVREIREEFDQICIAAGLVPDDVWMQTASFVSYGFNRGHASGYGIRSYRTAYLKAHYPVEYMTGLLVAWSGKKSGKIDKEKVYAREARRVGIRILPADVNISGALWTLDRKRNAIRRGLLSIKGVGQAAARSIEANAPFNNVEDMIERTDSRAVNGGKQYKDGDPETLGGVYKALLEANALNDLVEA